MQTQTPILIFVRYGVQSCRKQREGRCRAISFFPVVRNLLPYYVGIATKGDSFQRLIERAHEKRLSILTNESQIKPTARLSDEIILFLFDSVPLLIRSFSLEEDFSEFGSPPPYGSNQPNIDAEKALLFSWIRSTTRSSIRSSPKGPMASTVAIFYGTPM